MSDFPPQDQGIVLVGYRGTGKSTVGRLLAHRLGRPFIDLDREVTARARRSIREIFDQDGEPAFRDRESLALVDMAMSTRVRGGILATGGGAVLRESNRRLIREVGFVVWLAADPTTLTHRLLQSRQGVDDRPALTAAGTLAEIAGVLESRMPLYREVAHVMIETAGRSADEVADAVIQAWSRHLVESPSGVIR